MKKTMKTEYKIKTLRFSSLPPKIILELEINETQLMIERRMCSHVINCLLNFIFLVLKSYSSEQISNA